MEKIEFHNQIIEANAINKLVNYKIISPSEASILSADRIDELIVRCTDDFLKLQNELTEDRIKKMRRILGLSDTQDDFNINKINRFNEISVLINDLRDYLEKIKDKFDYIQGFVLFGSRMDPNKFPDKNSDIDTILILKPGYTCDPRIPEGEDMLFKLRDFTDNIKTNFGVQVELDEIFSTEEFVENIKGNSKEKIIWGWNPAAIKYIGEPVSGLSENDFNKHIQEVINSDDFTNLKKITIAEALKKIE